MDKKSSRPKSLLKHWSKLLLLFFLGIGLGSVIIIVISISVFEQQYKTLIYPGITIDYIPAGGQTPVTIQNDWLNRNSPFKNLSTILIHNDKIATVSAFELNIGYDATLSATQAYSIGRSGNWTSDTYHILLALISGINLKSFFTWNEDAINQKLNRLAEEIDIEPENALFEFKDNKVTVFKLSQPGQAVNIETTKDQLREQLKQLTLTSAQPSQIVIQLTVELKEPEITNDRANNLGIETLLGKGESWFKGSISGRIHNVALAASRLNGILIAPNETFSFNKNLGDVSAVTGYKQAYVIKNGRTVLDDGGGVCQVSTTLFRAGLNAGLAIVERHAHSYRVGYYEQGGFKPGFDATVYDPSYDLKIKNDTPAYILIQSATDIANSYLTFELYGKSDGRTVQISAVRLWDYQPAPPDLYQDDPTLPIGTVKQVDWANSGVKAAFDYTVNKGGAEIFKTTFYSPFIPWQAVFLKGTKT